MYRLKKELVNLSSILFLNTVPMNPLHVQGISHGNATSLRHVQVPCTIKLIIIKIKYNEY